MEPHRISHEVAGGAHEAAGASQDATQGRLSPEDGSRLPVSSRRRSRQAVSRLLSGDFLGLEGRPVVVEVDVSSRGKAGFSIVGLPGKSIKESRDRIRTAIRNSRFRFPYKESVIVNLAPATQQKDGSGFDLAVALGILLASGQIPRLDESSRRAFETKWGFVGELGLDGDIRAVPGALLAAHALHRRGVERVVVAPGNAAEVLLVRGLAVIVVEDLAATVDSLLDASRGESPRGLTLESPPLSAGRSGDDRAHAVDFSEVSGQEVTKRGLLVGAAGEHNLILVGPPGVGKTMLAKRLPGILPSMSYEEALEVTRIRSVLGESVGDRLASRRPFRAPHHTVSYAGLVGGGSRLRPGEITRAHRGVLFLDELPEFLRRVLEALREPIEAGQITLARGSGSVTYPSRFLLVCAMNPCPCGYHGHATRRCPCTPAEIRGYRGRLSGPLLDRFDLFLEVSPVPSSEILRTRPAGTGLDSRTLLQQVESARRRQRKRWKGKWVNGAVPLSPLLQRGAFRPEALKRLEESAERLGLSARGFARTLRVGRTIADLEGSSCVEAKHVCEALHYREPSP